jgi:type IV pilus assembly protein PilF
MLVARGLLLSLLAAALLGLAGCATQPQPGAELAVPVSPDQAELQRRAQVRLQLAIGYYSQGQMKVALEEANQALQILPEYADAFGVRALIYMELDEPGRAEDSFRNAMRLAPGNPDLANNYGWFLCQNGREREAIAYFESALKSRSYQSPVKALNNAGECSTRMKDYAGAERFLMRAHSFDPDSAETNTNLAKLYYSRGDFQRARSYLNVVTKSENPSADALWTALKVERKLGDNVAAGGMAAQLRRRFPESREYAALLRGEFDE